MADHNSLPSSAGKAEDVTLTWSEQLMSEATSPLNIVLIFAITYLLYKILRPESDSTPTAPVDPPLARMKKRDFTISDLRKYDGINNPEGRVLVAVLGKVYDVTKGKRFYGPGGPYSGFGGHDASRGLATFNVEAIKDDYDDISDLSASEMEQVREWELQFSEKYEFVGKLIKPSEEPTVYSDASSDEDEDMEKIDSEEAKKAD